jgi:hypothetical protein
MQPPDSRPRCGSKLLILVGPLPSISNSAVIRIWGSVTACAPQPRPGRRRRSVPSPSGRAAGGRSRVLLDLGHGAGLVVPGVGPLHPGRHEMVLPAGDEQQRRPVVVFVVDVGVLAARLQGGQRTAPSRPTWMPSAYLPGARASSVSERFKHPSWLLGG